MSIRVFLAGGVAALSLAPAQVTTRIAAVGNSITEYINSGVPGAVAADAYSARLNMLLGATYLVENDGRSGCYMQKPAGITPAIMSYWNQSGGKLQNVFALRPHIITIMLGTNDSRPLAWNTARYRRDGQALIDTFHNTISPRPTIWLVKPIPAWRVNGQWQFSNPSSTTNNGISGDIIRDSVIPAITQLAAANGLRTIDLYNSAFNAVNQPMGIMTGDGVHPNRAGQDTIAHIFYRALTAITPVLSHKIPGRNGGRARIVPVLFANLFAGSGKIFSLNGKAVSGSRPKAVGIYLLKPKP